jgi:hypothetical protein
MIPDLPNTACALEDIRLGIACPMANEGVDAVRFVKDVLAECDGLRQVQFFAVLDRATTDNTLDLLREYAQHESRLVVVWAPENKCVVDAYIRGYREAWLQNQIGFSKSMLGSVTGRRISRGFSQPWRRATIASLAVGSCLEVALAEAPGNDIS